MKTDEIRVGDAVMDYEEVLAVYNMDTELNWSKLHLVTRG